MLDKGELVAVVSMDLSKAFNVIQHNLHVLSISPFAKATELAHTLILM